MSRRGTAAGLASRKTRRCSHDTPTLEEWITCALDPKRLKPARQPEAVAAGFGGNCNPRDITASPDCLVAPAMQHNKQPFWARLELFTRLAFDAGKHTADQPARLAQLDDGNDRAIPVESDQGPAQVVRLGHRGTPSVTSKRRSCHSLAARLITSSSTATRRLRRRRFEPQPP
jgi:hypothetical protein